MDKKTFVDVVARQASIAAVDDTREVLLSPPGRKPSKDLLELSAFYRGLAAEDRQLVDRIMADVADATLFGVFCILDGVRAIEDGTKGRLILTHHSADSSSDLNPDQDLHDTARPIWTAEG